MPNIFLVSDTHFGHSGVCKFTQADGVTPLRPWDDPSEMDEAMVELWNETVKPEDKVYHLGDVVINRKSLNTVRRLNGDKVLIKGNHDIFSLNEYLDVGFRDIRAYHVLDGMIMSHIPVHTYQLQRFGTNIHGHLHSNRVTKEVTDWDSAHPCFTQIIIDPRYYNVCVEQTGFKPIAYDEVKANIVKQGGHVGFKEKNGVT